MIGYFGDDPGDPVIVPAGSVVCFSTTLFHRGGANTTGDPRRVYVAQYSAEPILSEDRSRPRHLAEPLLVAGERRPDRQRLHVVAHRRAVVAGAQRVREQEVDRHGLRELRCVAEAALVTVGLRNHPPGSRGRRVGLAWDPEHAVRLEG